MSNQQIILSQDQKSGTVTLIFHNADFLAAVGDSLRVALFPKSTIKPQLPQPQVTVTLGAF